ncbi:MAG TPA: histidinol dehydrogenase [Firmicutes bacterium]|jgi:histidinol dehydrogenase|nr:histidinol dehydrogenase [Bacillota bacterium]
MKIYTTEKQLKEVLQLLNRRAQFQGKSQADLNSKVAAIINDVKNLGDQALIDFTSRFDGVSLTADTLKVSDAELIEAPKVVAPEFIKAIKQAKDNILAFHTKQLPKDWLDIKDDGIILGQRIRPVDSAGLYVPGGVAGATPLVSSVLMNALPAVVAGVKQIVICTPPNSGGKINPHLLVAALECNIRDIYKVGGAQAVAAMAYGTETLKPVDVIVGPGNQYVTEAKRQVFGFVGLDMLAGPSEILIIADDSANPSYIAADLLSQAEHGPVNEAGAFLLTPSGKLAEAVAAEVEKQLTHLGRRQIAGASIEAHGGIVITADLDQALDLANYCAPEHMELVINEPWSYLSRINNAGAVFLGPYSTEPIGDYVAGTNHVLPTNGTARFASGLNVDHFMKKTSIISYNQAGLTKYGPAAITIAEVEGLDAHAKAIKIRLS